MRRLTHSPGTKLKFCEVSKDPSAASSKAGYQAATVMDARRQGRGFHTTNEQTEMTSYLNLVLQNGPVVRQQPLQRGMARPWGISMIADHGGPFGRKIPVVPTGRSNGRGFIIHPGLSMSRIISFFAPIINPSIS